jgi:hypothetical protein
MKKPIILAILLLLCSSFVWADLKGDINGDDKVGLEEAVYALQATSGLAVQPVEDTCITCDGTLSTGGRWCTPEPEDGTVKDMTTGLVWLKDASWGGLKKWRCTDSDTDPYDDAHTRAGVLEAGATGADLSDGSVVGDWRLPTKEELYDLGNGDEAVRSGSMQAFTGVQSSYYWSSSSYASYTSVAWSVYMVSGDAGYGTKDYPYYVWPVRSDN